MKDEDLKHTLELHFHDKITSQKAVGGGCIAVATIFTFSSGEQVFVKTGFSNGMFLNEANGLKELAKANAVRVPKVYIANPHFVAMECIQPAPKVAHFFETLGQQFAQLHRYSSSNFGFYEDNFIGSNPQMNIANGVEKTSWPQFYFNKRLRYQFEMACSKGYANSAFRSAFKNIENNIEQILQGSVEPPSLLHGDLWCGNYMEDEKGQPVLIDPAVYYGHREADLAMTTLFGGFSPEFYMAYQNEYPLKEGWEYRQNIYKLYHILNHLNLFGSSYFGESLQLMQCYG